MPLIWPRRRQGKCQKPKLPASSLKRWFSGNNQLLFCSPCFGSKSVALVTHVLFPIRDKGANTFKYVHVIGESPEGKQGLVSELVVVSLSTKWTLGRQLGFLRGKPVVQRSNSSLVAHFSLFTEFLRYLNGRQEEKDIGQKQVLVSPLCFLFLRILLTKQPHRQE